MFSFNLELPYTRIFMDVLAFCPLGGFKGVMALLRVPRCMGSYLFGCFQLYMVLMLGFSVQQQFSNTAELNMLCLIAMCRRPGASVRCQASYPHTLCLRCPRQKSCQIFGSRTFLQVEKAEKLWPWFEQLSINHCQFGNLWHILVVSGMWVCNPKNYLLLAYSNSKSILLEML